MDAQPTNPRRTWPALALVLALFLTATYIFSLGPAVFLCSRGMVRDEYVAPLYMPLLAVADRSPTLSKAAQWYISFWTPRKHGVVSAGGEANSIARDARLIPRRKS